MPYVARPTDGRLFWVSGNEPRGWVAWLSPVSLIDPERCQHENTDTEPRDMSVGFSGGTWCQDCAADLTDEYARDDWDDGDRAYDAWKDEREYDRS